MKGRPSFRVKIENDSPLVLNGLALAGASSKSDAAPQNLAGLALPPRRSLTVVADAALVERLGLKAGIKVHGADLSGL